MPKIGADAESAARKAGGGAKSSRAASSGLRVGLKVRTSGVIVHDEDGDLCLNVRAYERGQIVRKSRNEDGTVWIVRHPNGDELPWLTSELTPLGSTMDRVLSVFEGVF